MSTRHTVSREPSRRALRTALCTAAALTLTLNLHAATRYVDPARPNDAGPGTSWGSAFKTIQPAIDASAANDTVIVRAGTYNTGTANTTYGNSRISITKAITLRSESGPAATIIQGSGTATQGTTTTTATRTLTVHSLPATAQGTFNGTIEAEDYVYGTFTATTSAAGKFTGKLTDMDGTYTLTAPA